MAEASTLAAPSVRHSKPAVKAPEVPKDWKADLLSGFLVFLIALPLCLGIATASKFPPIAGIWTAVFGGVITIFFSNSPLTIKGPAAGLIVIVEGCVLELAEEFGQGLSPDQQIFLGYRLALGIGVVSGLVQVVLGLLKAGKLGELIPLTPIHGMLASIGVTIMAKQLFAVAGLKAPPGEPINAIEKIPSIFVDFIGPVFVVGLVSLAIMILMNNLPIPRLRKIPAQLAVLVIAIPFALWIGLPGNAYVTVPNVLQNLGFRFEFEQTFPFSLPDFRALSSATGLKWLFLFFVIGSLESLLSAKAVDLKDPWKRKTNLDSDLLGVGIANTLVAAIGGLPMISEIVRSSANIANGGRTKLANMFHGLFLLGFVLLVPALINKIPYACLGAMLVYTGFRLASPREFAKMWAIGWEQFLIFGTTIAVVLCTDLLVGVIAGIALKIVFQLAMGVPPSAYWRLDLETTKNEGGPTTILVRNACVFSTWLTLRRNVLEAAESGEVILDLSQTCYVDHSTMEKLHEMEHDMENENKHFRIIGLESHRAISKHPLAARRKPVALIAR